eukprot:2949462-Rhodomonas_salina.3
MKQRAETLGNSPWTLYASQPRPAPSKVCPPFQGARDSSQIVAVFWLTRISGQLQGGGAT